MARFIELNRPFVHKHNYRMTAEREEKKEERGPRDRLFAMIERVSTYGTSILWSIGKFMKVERSKSMLWEILRIFDDSNNLQIQEFLVLRL